MTPERAAWEDPDDIVCPDLAPAWPKACWECAFLPNDPQGLGSDVVAECRNAVISGDIIFYCVHRLSARGLHRECASANAIHKAALADGMVKEEAHEDNPCSLCDDSA